MKNLSNKPILLATLLDHLVDEAPGKLHDSIKTHHQQIAQLHLSVRRDLENLLNTRRPEFNWSAKWSELNRSLLTYGVKDLTGRDLSSAALQNKLCMELAGVIEIFETRLQQVKVKLRQTNISSHRTLQIRIEAILVANIAPAYIVFDSILEPDIGSFRIIGAD